MREATGSSVRHGGPGGLDAFGFLKSARIEPIGMDKTQAMIAAEAKSAVSALSLADAFAFALAVRRGGWLFTSDPNFDHPWIRSRIAITFLKV